MESASLYDLYVQYTYFILNYNNKSTITVHNINKYYRSLSTKQVSLCGGGKGTACCSSYWGCVDVDGSWLGSKHRIIWYWWGQQVFGNMEIECWQKGSGNTSFNKRITHHLGVLQCEYLNCATIGIWSLNAWSNLYFSVR